MWLSSKTSDQKMVPQNSVRVCFCNILIYIYEKTKSWISCDVFGGGGRGGDGDLQRTQGRQTPRK